ncbi:MULTISPECIES: monovalent cation/H(+) antiporter subunit G [unclassified Corynebacterium]|uniref:monovalent cation/H(+) antiporter subunit G n=1 Tax=unclassified Corynebacterium TaxID=2624378 RepID=UPI00352323B3
MTTLILDVLSLILLFLGSLLALSAAIGLARFRDTLTRLHAVTKPQTLGLILAVSGALLRVSGSRNLDAGAAGDLGVLILIIAFTLITAPVIGQRLGRLARKEKLYDPEALSRDDTRNSSSP